MNVYKISKYLNYKLAAWVVSFQIIGIYIQLIASFRFFEYPNFTKLF